MSSDERQIRDLVAKWMTASKAGDIATVLGLMADDIIFTVPGREPFGKNAFAQDCKAMVGAKFEGTSEVVELNIVGDWAWLRSRIRASITPPSGETRKLSGYTLSILARNAKGQWLLKRDANCLTPEK